MTDNSNTFRISNERIFLINILNTMYNDNLRQINSHTNILNNLIENNTQIRNTLISLLNVGRESNDRRPRGLQRINANSNANSNRNYRPYIFDLVAEYNIPISNETNTNRRINGLDNLFSTFFSPVEVYPTQSQIETATRRTRYCDIARPINTSCPISMEEFNDNDFVTVIRHCGHIFCTEHLMNWFRSNCRCPVCRYDIRDFNSNVATDIFNFNQNNVNFRNPTVYNDSSNNIIERNTVTRTNSNNSTTNSITGNNNNFLGDTNFFGLQDLSGNFTNDTNYEDMLLGLSVLLNTMNRNNTTRRDNR